MRYLKVVKVGIWMWAVLGLLPTQTTAQPCGGIERWAVKMGGDAGASQIDTANPVTTLLHSLIVLQRPQLPPGNDETTRLTQERTVRIVDGRLMRFRLETGRSGDQDYHLVISDDTLQFSPGGSGTQPVPHSFVAEIVNPNCVAGRNGTSPTPSLLQSELVAVRAKFDQQFPNVTGTWTNANALPVRVRGVTFYDRQHNQTGRAMNGIEIHPVLDIDFNPTPPVIPIPGTTDVALINPGFESGNQGWTTTANVITADTNEPAHTGTSKAWLGGYGTSHTDRLWQQVSLPGNVTAATLEFYLHISTEEVVNQTFDTLRVRVRNSSGQLLDTLRTYTNQQAALGFSLQSLNLTPFRGQSIRIELFAQEDNGKFTSFVVDDFRVIVE